MSPFMTMNVCTPVAPVAFPSTTPRANGPGARLETRIRRTSIPLMSLHPSTSPERVMFGATSAGGSATVGMKRHRSPPTVSHHDVRLVAPPGHDRVIKRRRRRRTKRYYRSYAEARMFAISQGITTQRHWHRWSKAGNRPADIPGNPQDYYSTEEWKGWGHFLGTNNISKNQMKFRSFEETRAYVAALGLRTQKEWQSWSKSGKRPTDIPSNPQSKYKEKGWRGWQHFLSTSSFYASSVPYSSLSYLHSQHSHFGGGDGADNNRNQLMQMMMMMMARQRNHSKSTFNHPSEARKPSSIPIPLPHNAGQRSLRIVGSQCSTHSNEMSRRPSFGSDFVLI